MTLPTDPAARKAVPVYSGCLRYFPRAIAAVAELSRVANDQHNPGEPLHWSRDKSADHHDCLARHLLEAGEVDGDGQRHSAKVAWRALAALELELEAADAPAGSLDALRIERNGAAIRDEATAHGVAWERPASFGAQLPPHVTVGDKRVLTNPVRQDTGD